MKLNLQKKLAAAVSKVSKSRISLDISDIEKVKSAITRADIRGLITKKIIKVKSKSGSSKSRIRKIQLQKRKGRRKTISSRKGTHNARLSRKREWINKIRIQRSYLKQLRDQKKVEIKIYQQLYRKVKGGFFRSKRHITTYLTENQLIKNGKK